MLAAIIRISIAIFFTCLTAGVFSGSAQAEEIVCEKISSDDVKISKVVHADGAVSLEVFFPERRASFKLKSVELYSSYKQPRCSKCKSIEMSSDLAGNSEDGYFVVGVFASKVEGLSLKMTATYIDKCVSTMDMHLIGTGHIHTGHP